MENLKEKAFEKMLKELETSHTSAIDAIHNFLCDQEDEKIFEGIMKEDRTIYGSLRYAAQKAKAQATDGCAVVSDKDVFDWVIEYFTVEETPEVSSAPARVEVAKTKEEVKPIAKKPEGKPAAKHEDSANQLSIFDY